MYSAHIKLCVCTWCHVFWFQADLFVLAVGARQPRRGSQGGLPTHCCVCVQVILEELFLHIKSQTHRKLKQIHVLAGPIGGAVGSPWPEAPWRPLAPRWSWWAWRQRRPRHRAHCTLSWAGRPSPAVRRWRNRDGTGLRWRRVCRCMKVSWGGSARYLMWFGRAKTAAFHKVRRLRDYLIYEHSGIPLQNKPTVFHFFVLWQRFLVNDNWKVTPLSISSLFLWRWPRLCRGRKKEWE